MKRREFGIALAGGVAGAAASGIAHARPKAERSSKPKAQMYLAEDHWDRFEEEGMEYLQRHGVKHVEVEHIKQSEAGDWDLDELKRLRDLADKNDFSISMLNFSKTRYRSDRNKELFRGNNHIMAGTEGERDRQIDVICRNIEKAAAIGVPAMRYHWRMVPGDYRNHKVKDRPSLVGEKASSCGKRERRTSQPGTRSACRSHLDGSIWPGAFPTDSSLDQQRRKLHPRSRPIGLDRDATSHPAHGQANRERDGIPVVASCP